MRGLCTPTLLCLLKAVLVAQEVPWILGRDALALTAHSLTFILLPPSRNLTLIRMAILKSL